MSKRTMDINQRLNEISEETREHYLKLIKIDPEAVREIENRTAKQYDELIENLQANIHGMGKEAENQYKLSVERYNKIHLEAVQALVDLPRIPNDVLIPYCFCFPYTPAEFIEKSSPEPIIIGNATASHDPGDTPQSYKLKVDAKGPGAGTSTAEVKAIYKFTFEPPKTGTYCISPHIFLNGHWLAWSWGTCSTPQDTGAALVKVDIKVLVDQLSSTIKTHEHNVLDIFKQAGSADQLGFNYNSITDGGSSTKAYLMGGYDAVVFVEVKATARVLKHGRAIVDMKTSPSFGCTVDNVLYGRRKCWPIIWSLVDIVEALQI